MPPPAGFGRHHAARLHECIRPIVWRCLGIIAVALIALYIVLYRTRNRHDRTRRHRGFRHGSIALGIDVYKVFMLVFGASARWRRASPAIINAPVVSIAPDVGESISFKPSSSSYPARRILPARCSGAYRRRVISITSMFNPGYSYVMLSWR